MVILILFLQLLLFLFLLSLLWVPTRVSLSAGNINNPNLALPHLLASLQEELSWKINFPGKLEIMIINPDFMVPLPKGGCLYDPHPIVTYTCDEIFSFPHFRSITPLVIQTAHT